MKTIREPRWGVLVAAEIFSATIGFAVLIRSARLLGPEAFSSVEYAAAVAGVVLVAVRGGVETIVHREAARRPRLIAPLSEALILVKITLAALGLLVIAALGFAGGRPAITLVGGCLLIPAALCLDVGPRALGQFGVLAAVQAARAIGIGCAALLLVRGPENALGAASCAVIAESVAAVAFAAIHIRLHGMPRPRIRLHAAWCLAERGAVASLCRLGRVFLYAADVLVLCTLATVSDAGTYAAGRRVVFAIIGIAVVVPAALGPIVAAAWKESGPAAARALIERSTSRLLGPAVAVAFGLILTAEGWMPFLFGSIYRDGSASLRVIAARLPLLLLAATVGTTLIAVRRERESLRIVGTSCALALVVVPIAALIRGAIGAGVAMIGVELFAAAAGWIALRKIAAAPRFPVIEPADLLAIVAMAATVLAVGNRSVVLATVLGGSVFVLVRMLASRPLRLSLDAEAAR